jgi:hypothetical protein
VAGPPCCCPAVSPSGDEIWFSSSRAFFAGRRLTCRIPAAVLACTSGSPRSNTAVTRAVLVTPSASGVPVSPLKLVDHAGALQGNVEPGSPRSTRAPTDPARGHGPAVAEVAAWVPFLQVSAGLAGASGGRADGTQGPICGGAAPRRYAGYLGAHGLVGRGVEAAGYSEGGPAPVALSFETGDAADDIRCGRPVSRS